MASAALAPRADTGFIRVPPRPLALFAFVLAGCGAAGFSVLSALTSDHVREPEVQAALVVWVVLAYVLAGVIAWWRRPESRLGLLMIAAGFGTFISMLGVSDLRRPWHGRREHEAAGLLRRRRRAEGDLEGAGLKAHGRHRRQARRIRAARHRVLRRGSARVAMTSRGTTGVAKSC